MAVFDDYYDTLENTVSHYECKLATAATETERIGYFMALQTAQHLRHKYEVFKQEQGT